jgi:hypothetical protein
MLYLHKLNIVHCDLKSRNLLIDKDWNGKLCDFGLRFDGAARVDATTYALRLFFFANCVVCDKPVIVCDWPARVATWPTRYEPFGGMLFSAISMLTNASPAQFSADGVLCRYLRWQCRDGFHGAFLLCF